MDIQQLRYFAKVYETLNYSKSAEEMFITRQALRQVIRNLEKEVGYPLFRSLTNKLEPTLAGQLLYQSAQDTMRAYSNLENDMKNLQAQLKNDIRYGLMPGLQDIFHAKTIEYVREFYSDYSSGFHISFISDSCSRLRQMITEGTLDCARYCSTGIGKENFDCQIDKGPEPVYLLVGQKSPLSEKKTISIEDLRGQNFATQGMGYDIHDLIMQQCRNQGFEPRIAFTSPNTFGLLNLVRTGFAVSYSYTETMLHYNAPDVVCIPFEEPCMQWCLVTIYQKGLTENHPIRLFLRRSRTWW